MCMNQVCGLVPLSNRISLPPDCGVALFGRVMHRLAPKASAPLSWAVGGRGARAYHSHSNYPIYTGAAFDALLFGWCPCDGFRTLGNSSRIVIGSVRPPPPPPPPSADDVGGRLEGGARYIQHKSFVGGECGGERGVIQEQKARERHI